MWARMKTELLYDRYDLEQLTVEQLKSLVWRLLYELFEQSPYLLR